MRSAEPGAEARFVLHGAIAVILAILAEGFFEYNLGDSEVLTMFLAVLGFGYIALEKSTEPKAVRVGATSICTARLL